jgi:hypothetical protein
VCWNAHSAGEGRPCVGDNRQTDLPVSQSCKNLDDLGIRLDDEVRIKRLVEFGEQLGSGFDAKRLGHCSVIVVSRRCCVCGGEDSVADRRGFSQGGSRQIRRPVPVDQLTDDEFLAWCAFRP